MYIFSDEVQSRISEVAALVSEATHGVVVYEEFIAIPVYGNIILRFTLCEDGYGLEDLDHYERIIYDIVGDEFLIDFMGSVYRKVGVDMVTLESRLIKCAKRYESEVVMASVHAGSIVDDAKGLLKRMGLDICQDVWEIQAEEDSIVLLIMGEQSRHILEMEQDVRISVREVDRESCQGLIKAAFFAKRKRVSIARLLMTDEV